MTSICPNKLMMMFPLITSLAVNFYMKGWINEWKLEQNTYAWSRIPHLWLPKSSIKCPWELPQIWISNTNLVWFCAPWCEVHHSQVTWELTQANSFSKVFSPLMSTSSQSIGPCNPNIPTETLSTYHSASSSKAVRTKAVRALVSFQCAC